MKKQLLTLCALAAIVTSAAQTEFVNPMIGTAGMGHTFPGACVPFGGVQLSPDTDTIPHNIKGVYQPDVYAYCAGYQHADSSIVGFSHTHMSGTGHSDLGDILLIPTTGKLKLNPGTAANPDCGYRSRFSHNTEQTSPGYYGVRLDDYGIDVELTATDRVGVHRYTYPATTDTCRLIIDLNHGLYNYDGKTLWASLRVENDTLLTGCRITNGWARLNYTFFAISLSKPIKSYGYQDLQNPQYKGFWRKFSVNDNFPEMGGRKLVAHFEFDPEEGRELEVRVALSSTESAGAVKNLLAETSGKTFNDLRNEATQRWADELGMIEIEGTDAQKAMFYTSLYHTMINPSTYMDVDGRYRGLDQNIHQADGFTNHTIFSLWDTYRAEHPLLTLLKPKRAADMVQSMLKHQQQSVHKMLPIWSHMANDNWCMTGYHAVSVLADAFDAGIATDTFDILTAMNQTSKVDYFDGLDDYQRLGYVPFDHSATSTSTTLEYALNDWAIYRTALNAGNLPMAREYRRRALNYRNVYDPTIGYARPRLASGEFKKDFNILQTSGEGFIEGNSQNFSFHVPHDVAGIIDLMGGEAAFRHKLDELFANDLPEEYYADNEDVTSECLIGGYVHGNEPSHHIPYLYAWTSEPWKTQHWVREIMNRMYRPEIRGLGGNDDCGQMSAWYVFSALGFYPVCPGTGQFVLGAPYIPYAKITLPNGKTFEVKAPRVSDKNRYVKEVKLNGKPHSKLYLTRSDILDGGVLEFVMTDKPNTRRGLNRDDKPYSLSTETWTDYPTGYVNFIDKAPESAGSQIYHSIVPNPQEYIARQARQVLNTLYFSPMDSIVPVDTIHYTLEDRAGVSAKDGDNGIVSVFYSTRHVENSFANNDTAKVDFETRGVLLHELTHAFQLEPQGVGTYSTNPIFYAFIEGMADAVRIYNGGFHDETDRPKGGNYDDGYRTTGYFLVWLTKNKDSDFLRKFNRTALEVIPWSFDGAMQKVLGPDVTAAELWREYQLSLGEEMD